MFAFFEVGSELPVTQALSQFAPPTPLKQPDSLNLWSR
jgi:hypothetical protein